MIDNNQIKSLSLHSFNSISFSPVSVGLFLFDYLLYFCVIMKKKSKPKTTIGYNEKSDWINTNINKSWYPKGWFPKRVVLVKLKDDLLLYGLN